MTVRLSASAEGIGAGLDHIEQILTKYGLKRKDIVKKCWLRRKA